MNDRSQAPIAISVNGEPTEIADGSTVLDVARACGLRDDERGVAIARGGAVVPRSGWAAARLQDGDTLEVVRASAGG